MQIQYIIVGLPCLFVVLAVDSVTREKTHLANGSGKWETHEAWQVGVGRVEGNYTDLHDEFLQLALDLDVLSTLSSWTHCLQYAGIITLHWCHMSIQAS